MKRYNCYICKQPSASVKCAQANCKRIYHQICGHNARCAFEFLDEFKSYCADHVIQRPLERRILDHCYVCFTAMDAQDYSPVSWVPSCGCKPIYIHLECARRWALASGYMCNCNCGDGSEEYHDMLRNNGVFVPHKDAAWEESLGAYASLQIIPDTCDAASCGCPRGRRFAAKSGTSKWYLNRCSTCGSGCIHSNCWTGMEHGKKYSCSRCEASSTLRKSQLEVQPDANDEDAEIISLSSDEGDEKMVIRLPLDPAEHFKPSELMIVERRQLDLVQDAEFDEEELYMARIQLLGRG